MATNYVSLSSNSIVIHALKQLDRTQFPKGRLIGPRNKYAIDLNAETKNPLFATGSPTINSNQLSQYIASSILVHCFDGWNFIARAFDALLAGDNATAIHMAYYAELRGAMSILASEGIGVFNRKHLYFDSGNAGNVFGLTTHAAAKQLMDEWASLPIKKQIVFECIQVNNRNLAEWISASGHSAGIGYPASILKDWLNLWSIDLKLDIDQGLRNETSYRPHFTIPDPQISDRVKELIEIWEKLEPSNGNGYFSLDMHLLRLTLENIFRLDTGLRLRHHRYRIFIDDIFFYLGESKEQYLYDFLFRRKDASDHILLAEARKDSKDPSVNFENPMSMICRAILLHRFAAGIAKIMLAKSDVNPDNLQNWWQSAALKYGLIREIDIDIKPTELYLDVSDSILNIRNFSSPLTNVREVNEGIISDLTNLKQFQRICFWGIGL